MLTSSIFDVKRNYNYSLNEIISLGPITCFHYFTRILYILKVIITKITMSECGWSRNDSHKWFANSNLHAFFGWKIIKFWIFCLMNNIRNSHSLVYTVIISPYFSFIISLKKCIHLDLTWYWFYFSGKCGSSLKSLIFNLPTKQSGPYLEHW